MKLVVIATLIAACAAGRLEHLERSYLPPGNSIISAKQSNSRGFGSAFDLGSSFGQHQSHPQNSFPSASNRYLPPAKVASADATQFIGAVKGFGGLQSVSALDQQYSKPSMSYGTPQGLISTGRSQSQVGATSRQYLAPNANSKQNIQTGAPNRQYLAPNAGSSQKLNQQFGISSGGQNQQYASATSRQYLTPNSVGSQVSRQQITGSNAGQQQRVGAAPSRQYLTPQMNNFPSTRNNLFEASDNIQQQKFGTATSRQYLAPLTSVSQGSSNHKFGGSSLAQQQFRSSTSQFFASNADQLSGHQKESSQFGTASRQLYLAPHVSSVQKGVSSRYQSMLGTEGLAGSSRMYLAPRSDSFQGIPQQAFNERTGYQY